MISIDKINETILELEQNDTTYATVERLAWLYTVKDHLTVKHTAEEPKPVKQRIQGDSEFIKLVNAKKQDDVWRLLDELVDTVKITSPQLYKGLIKKLNEL